MTPTTKNLVDMFEKMKKQNQEQFDRVTRMPGFRMVQWNGSQNEDVTDQYKQRLLDAIDQWQTAIDYLKRHDP